MTKISLLSKKRVILFCTIILNSVLALAQNAADSDLSNDAGSNKNWDEGWWPFALVALLLVIGFFVYRRRKRRTL